MDVVSAQPEGGGNRALDVQQQVHSTWNPEKHHRRGWKRAWLARVELLHLPAPVLTRMPESALSDERKRVNRPPGGAPDSEGADRRKSSAQSIEPALTSLTGSRPAPPPGSDADSWTMARLLSLMTLVGYRTLGANQYIQRLSEIP